MIFDIEPKYKINDELILKIEKAHDAFKDMISRYGFGPDTKTLKCKVVDYCGDRINPDIDIASDELRFNGSYEIVLLFRDNFPLICEEKLLISLNEIREVKLNELGI